MSTRKSETTEAMPRVGEIDYAVANGARETDKNEPSEPAMISLEAGFHGKFVVSMTGTAYDVRARGLNQEFRLLE
jgi:hypothetical protein